MKIEEETFYLEPPFSYRPSIAEYLSTMKVTKNGLIADILHLDKKGNIEIEHYFDDGFAVLLRNKNGLNDNEVFLWEFLEKKAEGKRLELKFSELNRIVGKYESLVIGKASTKFGSKVPFNPTKSRAGFIIFGIFASFILSFLTQFFYMPAMIISFILGAVFSAITGISLDLVSMALSYGISLLIPLYVVYQISKRKIKKSKIEKKFLMREIIFNLFKLYLLNYLLFFVIFFPLALLTVLFVVFIALLPLFLIGYLIFFIFYMDRFGRIAYKFLCWLMENKETAEHRKKWLSFKEFVIEHSEIEESPIKYYELWDEFYYYALATGAMKNKL